jgi:hypothetical protein
VKGIGVGMNTSHFEVPGRPSNSVRQVENQDGSVLLDIRQGLCFSINPIGSKIWNMMKQEQSFDDIVDNLAAEFSIPKEQIRDDVREFATLLYQKGLLLSTASQSARRFGALRNLIHRFKGIRICC